MRSRRLSHGATRHEGGSPCRCGFTSPNGPADTPKHPSRLPRQTPMATCPHAVTGTSHLDPTGQGTRPAILAGQGHVAGTLPKEGNPVRLVRDPIEHPKDPNPFLQSQSKSPCLPVTHPSPIPCSTRDACNPHGPSWNASPAPSRERPFLRAFFKPQSS